MNMRKAWWLVSTPLVLGGLTLASGAAGDLLADNMDGNIVPVAETAPAKKGGMYYFSKSGKGGETAAPTGTAARRTTKTTRSAPPATDDAEVTPERYTRSRTPANGARPTKNYYDQLFDESAPEGTAQAAPAKRSLAKTQTPAPTATRTAKPAPAVEADLGEPEIEQVVRKAPAKPQAARKPVAGPDDLAVDDATDVGGVVQAKHDKTAAKPAREIELTEAQRRANRPIPAEPVDPGAEADEADIPVRKAPATRSTTTTAAKPVAKPLPATTAAKKPVAPVTTAAKEPAAKEPAPTRQPVKTVAAETPAPEVKTAEVEPEAPAKTLAKKAEVRAIESPVLDNAATKDEVNLTSAAAEPAAPTTTAAVATADAEFDPAESTGQSPNITLRWETRGEVNVGQECVCQLVVKNSSKVPARDVVVEAFFPRSVRLKSSEPLPSNTGEQLTWNFQKLGAGEEKAIAITMIPSKRGELATSATVRFTGVAATVLKVEEPQLKIAVKGPAAVEIGEAATQTLVVTNPGSGVARDVTIFATIPDGLETGAAGKKVQLAIGALNAGETREVKLSLAAIGGGDQLLLVEARAEGNLVSEAEAAIRVTAPKLNVSVEGPSLRYVNRNATFVVTATNKGAAATNNVRVIHIVPAGFEYVKADKGGTYNPANRTVSWFVGRVEAGESVQVHCELQARDIGAHKHLVQAAGDNGALAEAGTETKVDGSASLVVSIKDADDPVEVKAETVYEVTVRNDGSKAAQNVLLACDLPRGITLIGCEAPTASAVKEGVLTFQPLVELAAGDSQTFKIKVSSQVPGNLKFRARLTSASVTEPLVADEITKFYAD
jgi:uncharacterized repeat protein (TIGR01451 family)